MSVYVLLDLNAVCRFCLQPQENLSIIFEDDEDRSISRKASEIAGIIIGDDENLPRQSCEECRDKIYAFLEFKNMIIQSQNILMEKSATIVKSEDLRTYHRKKRVDLQKGRIETFNKTKSIKQETLQPIIKIKNHQDLRNSRLIELNAGDINTSKTKNAIYPSMLKALKNDQCLLCLEQCSNRQFLHQHVDAHIAGTQLDPYYLVNDKHIVCRACNKKFKYRYNFLEHQRQHLNIKPFVCYHGGCRLSFYSNAAFKQHLPFHAAKNYVCATCGQAFKRKSDLCCHEIIHKDDGKLYTCTECFKQFKNRITLKAHAKTHAIHPTHKCHHCSKRYYSRSELQRHMFRHREKMFSCQPCGRSYYSKSALNRHIREPCAQAKITNKLILQANE